jgi:hypothetical protein
MDFVLLLLLCVLGLDKGIHVNERHKVFWKAFPRLWHILKNTLHAMQQLKCKIRDSYEWLPNVPYKAVIGDAMYIIKLATAGYGSAAVLEGTSLRANNGR